MSAAIQIKAPPPDPPGSPAAGQPSELRSTGPQPGLKMCRNELIHGSCKYENDGCIFYHPSKDAQPSQAQSTPTSPSFTSATPKSAPSFSVQNVLNVPSFVPRALSTAAPTFSTESPVDEAPSSTKSTPVLSALSPAFTLAGPSGSQSPLRNSTELPSASGLANGLADAYTKLSLSAAPFDPSNSKQSASDLGDIQPLEEVADVHYADESAGYYSELAVAPRQPLDYNLYVTPLPHVQTLTTSSSHSASSNIHTFFLSPSTHQTLTARAHASLETTPVPIPTLPRTLHVYHSLHSLEPNESQGVDGRSAGDQGAFGGLRTEAFRASSTVDGNLYCLRRVEGFKIVHDQAFSSIESWRRIVHPNVVGVREAFTTRAFGDSSVVFAYDYHPASHTLFHEHFVPRPPTLGRNGRFQPQDMHVPERVVWSYAVQLASALKRVHDEGLAARVLEPSKILVTGRNRLRLNCCGLLDVVTHGSNTNVGSLQQDDVLALGKLLLALTNVSTSAVQNVPNALDVLARSYSEELHNFVVFLLSSPPPGMNKSIEDVLQLLGPHILADLNAALDGNDVLESEMGKELENGRLVRLLTKFGFINERPEFDHDPRWSESGDRYIIKLFRDMVFHQVDESNLPVLDLSHVLTCLNKLDAGSDEKIMLMSRDEQSCLVVSYRDLKTCIEAAFNDLARGTSL